MDFVTCNWICYHILVIKRIRLLLRGRPILLITGMITDRIGLHSVLLALLIIIISWKCAEGWDLSHVYLLQMFTSYSRNDKKVFHVKYRTLPCGVSEEINGNSNHLLLLYCQLFSWYTNVSFCEGKSINWIQSIDNRPRSIYQYSNKAQRLSGKL